MSTLSREPGLPRVAFLARNMEGGGAERTYLDLVSHARAVSPVVALLHRRGKLLHSLPGDAEVHELDAPVLGGPAARVEALPGGSVWMLLIECRRLALLVDALEIRVVSSFLMRSHIVALLVKLLLRPRLRVVLNIHEHMTESAGYLYPNAVARAVADVVTRRLFRRADRVVVVARELERDLVESFGLPTSLVHTMWNPVDLDGIRARSLEQPLLAPPATRPVVCAVGRLVKLKGFDMLLHAFALLQERAPSRLVIVGDGPERRALADLAVKLGVDALVQFTGWDDNPWRHMRASAVFALTSRTEAFPSVLTEAMAVGVPIVAMECSGGVRECLSGGDAGLLVPPGDIASMARALERGLLAPELAESLRVRGSQRVAQLALETRVAAYDAMLLDQDRLSRQQGRGA